MYCIVYAHRNVIVLLLVNSNNESDGNHEISTSKLNITSYRCLQLVKPQLISHET